jgi:protease II
MSTEKEGSLMPPTIKDPSEDWTLEQWKDWVRDREDRYFRTVQVDARVLIALVKQRDDAVNRLFVVLQEEKGL